MQNFERKIEMILHPRKMIRQISLPLYNKLYALEYAFYRRKTISNVRHKKCLSVLFMVIEAGMWKYDSLYEAMLQDNAFNPILCVVPKNMIEYDSDLINDNIQAIKNIFDSRHYEYIECSKGNGKYLDVWELDPAIIIYLNPYDRMIDSRYHYSNFKNILTCYIDYSFCITNRPMHYNEPIQISAWRNFVPTSLHKDLTKLYAYTNRNVVVTGYPVYDMFKKEMLKKGEISYNKKVVVWAPHQSIFLEKDVHWSTFLLYSEFMLSIAEQHKHDLYFVFRPHPELKENLYKHIDWGRKRPDEYYQKWEHLPNAEISTTDYVKQFCCSDAMIHDGGGFMAEYLYTEKPCLSLSNYIADDIFSEKFNKIGVEAWNVHYHASSEEEIISFLEDVVINGKDPKKAERLDVLRKYVLPPYGKMVAENIIDEIKKSIWKRRT